MRKLAVGASLCVALLALVAWKPASFLPFAFGTVALLPALWCVRVAIRAFATASLGRRMALTTLLIAYGMTAFVGAPAVSDEFTEQVVAAHNTLRAELPQLVATHWETPRLWTVMMVPLVPGVVFSVRGYSYGPRDGAETVDLSLWYGSGVTTFLRIPLSIS